MKKGLFVLFVLVMSLRVMYANECAEAHVQTPSAMGDVKEGFMISGHVIEKESEEDIPYASVLIVGTDRGTMSNEAGQFQFKNLAEGSYVLRVSAVGYKTLEKTNPTTPQLRPPQTQPLWCRHS